MNKKIKIAPSVLSADFSKMGEEVESIAKAGADYIHLDVMDGVFVPNISFGIKMVADIRKHTELPLDTHLMIVDPQKYVKRFADAGSDIITVHYEACEDKTENALQLIKDCGVKSGLVISPDTPVSVIVPFLPLCDIVLIMSVYPGFGGQKFISGALEKLKAARAYIDLINPSCELEIDGGINAGNAASAIMSGADVLVAGSAVFNATDRIEAVSSLRKI